MSGDDDASTNDPQEQNSDVFAYLSDADRHRIWHRLLSRPERKEPPPAPLTDFDRAFQTHVGTKLEGFVRLGAYLVCLELESFSDAHNRVMRVANKYGAGHLSHTAFLTLDSWIDQALLAAIDAGVPEGLVTPAQLARIRRECGP